MSDILDEGKPSSEPGVSGLGGGDVNNYGRGAAAMDESRVVAARGTEDGLVLRIDGRAEWKHVIKEIEAFLGSRKKFFEGGELSIEWLESLPTKTQSKELEQLLKDNYGMTIITRRKRPARKSTEQASAAKSINELGDVDNSESPVQNTKAQLRAREKQTSTAIPLFDDRSSSGVSVSSSARSLSSQIEVSSSESSTENSERTIAQKYVHRVARLLGEEIYYDDDANARIVYGTLRSGQKIETPFSLIVIGDVNPGADLTAGGDIIVLGSLRGTAHASAYDDESFDNVIISLHMQPMQLRIGSVISRGSDDVVHGAEIARIENRRIIVEQFNPRALSMRSRQVKL